MQKIFFSNLILSLFLNFLIKPISVLYIDVGVQGVVGNEAYGTYFTLLSLTLVFNIVLDLGINNFTVRSIAQNGERLTHHFQNMGLIRLILFLVYVGAVSLTAMLLKYDHTEFYMLFFLVINQFLIQTIAFLRSHFSGLQLFRIDTILSVLDRFLLILIMGFFLCFRKSDININGFIYAQTASYFAVFLIAIYFMNQKLSSFRFYLNWAYARSVLLQSLPFAVLILLMLLYNRQDTIILKQIHPQGKLQAGIYAESFRLLDALYMVGMIFAGILYPMFSKMIHEGSKEIKNLIQQSARILIGGGLGLIFILILNSNFILNLIYHKPADQTSFCFVWLMAAFIPMCFNFIFGTFMTAHGNLKVLNVISLIGVLCSLGLNLWFIPYYGASASAVIAFITQSVVSILLLIRANFDMKMGLGLVVYGKLFLFATWCILVALVLYGLDSGLVKLILSLCLVALGFLMFSIVDFKYILAQLKFKETVQ